MERKSGLIID